MITTYHRPKTLDEALTLLMQPGRMPLGGGTLLSRPMPDSVEAVDLQSVGLDTVRKQGKNLEIGATVTLQQLLESEHSSTPLKAALQLEAPLNVRNAATVAGTLVAADGRSPFATMLLALDAKLQVESIESIELVEMETESRPPQRTVESIAIGEFLPLRAERIHGKLITSIVIPQNATAAFEYISRTPTDKPIVCAALVQWSSGRTRLTLGGFGSTPLLAMDGTESQGLETAARNAFHEASDEWASAEFRMDVAATLAARCAAGISGSV